MGPPISKLPGGKACLLWPVADNVFAASLGASAQRRIAFNSSLLKHTLLEQVPVACDLSLRDAVRRGMAQFGLQAGGHDLLSQVRRSIAIQDIFGRSADANKTFSNLHLENRTVLIIEVGPGFPLQSLPCLVEPLAGRCRIHLRQQVLELLLVHLAIRTGNRRLGITT